MKISKTAKRVLVGNSFPFPLIKRDVNVRVKDLPEFKAELVGCKIHSFWGHVNTLNAVNAFAGMDLTPHAERPVLFLSEKGLPMLDGFEFDTCWVLSPVYKRNFRAGIGEEVSDDMIETWNIKKMEWKER